MIINLFPAGTIAPPTPPTPESLGSWSISVTDSWFNYYTVSVTFTPYTQFVSSGINWNISCQDLTPYSSTPGDVEAKVTYDFGANPSGSILNLTATRADGAYTENYDYTIP